MRKRYLGKLLLSLSILLVTFCVVLVVCPGGATARSVTTQPTTQTTQPTTKAAATSRTVDVSADKAESTIDAGDVTCSIAHIRLSGAVLESPPSFSFFTDPSNTMTLKDWLQRLAGARKDDGIDAVALEVGSVRMSWAQAQELADAVKRLDAAKPVHTYLTSGGVAQYLVASAGRDVSMEPTGSLMIVGLGAELTFFRGTLDLVGIEPQIIQVGRFKGSGEPYTQTQPSPEMLEEYNKILDDLYDQLCGQIADQRKLDIAAVEKAIDSGPIGASAALEAHLVDRLVRKIEWREQLRERIAGKDSPSTWRNDYGKKSPRAINVSNPWSLFSAIMGGRKRTRTKDPTIAIIHANGIIVSGRSGEGLFGQRIVGAKTLVKSFERVRKDDNVKAVILRIDSPGGSALASELIYQAVERCSREKPVVASIAQTGASGGYYIAVGAKTIVADKSAIVGSIGVMSGKLAISGLLEKLGITTYELTRGRNAGIRMSRPWTQREQAVIRKHAERTYDVFVRRVGESRGERVADLDAVAQGRVFTARQAKTNGLIDHLGGLNEALRIAKKAAGVTRCHFITLPEPKTLMDFLAGGEDTKAPQMILAEWMLTGNRLGRSKAVAYLVNLAAMLKDEGVLAAMPSYLSVGQ